MLGGRQSGRILMLVRVEVGSWMVHVMAHMGYDVDWCDGYMARGLRMGGGKCRLLYQPLCKMWKVDFLLCPSPLRYASKSH